MSAIFKREFKSYFTSPLGYIVVILYLLLSGFMFTYVFCSGNRNIENYFYNYYYSFIYSISFFLIPVLTMRLFSEERRAKTDQALLTAPIKITHIVMGKFFAAFAIVAMVNSISLIYEFIFSIKIEVNWLLYLSSLLGTLLFSAALISIGVFISALTENQMVAAVGSVAASLVIMMMDTIAQLAGSIEFIYKSLSWMSFTPRFNSFLNGLFNYTDVAFFISFTAIFLFLTVRVVEKRRWAGGSKEQGYALVALLTFAATALLGYYSAKYYISNASETGAGATNLIIAIVCNTLSVGSAVACIWSAIKFSTVHNSRKKGIIIVKLDQKGEWKCPVCGTHNTDINSFCIKCDIQRATNERQAAAYIKPSKKRSVKHGAYALVVSALFVAVLVGLNVAASMVAEAYPLTLDLTSEGDYSISEENLKYINNISRDVTITVCANKDEYSNGTYEKSLAYSGVYDISNGMFFTQTETLLREYEQRNDKVKVQYIDPQSTDFTAYSAKYTSESFSTGDILVECSFELDGKKVNHYRHLDAFDLYTIEETQNSNSYSSLYYNGYTYALHESNVETAVTSSIYAVTADKEYKVALITANNGQKIDSLQNLMEYNNYSFTEITNLITQDIPKDADLVIIAAPTTDYSDAELKKLDDFLDVDGKQGKNILYIADPTQGDNVPNLTAFIGEWGFNINTGYAYATDEGTHYPLYPTCIIATAAESDYLKGLGDTNYLYISDTYSAINVSFDENESRQTENVISLPESAVCCPLNADKDWKPDDNSVKGPFVALGISTDTGYDDDYNPRYSRVMVIGGMNFINTSFNSQASVGNLKAVLSAVNYMYDNSGESITFDARKLSNDSFTVTAGVASFMLVLFVIVIPAIVLTICIVVYVRRKHL